MKDRKELNKIRRKNAKLFPIYKMFSWDLLFFYSIQFLFYTITKELSTSQVLTANSLLFLFNVITQVPSVTIIDLNGKRNSIILGNILLIISVSLLLIMPGMISVVLSNLFFAFGYNLKLLSETNLLYDSVATRGGDGLYTKIDGKGGSLYYLVDGIAAMITGYLFVLNNYIPIILCLLCVIIATIISLGFNDIYEVNKKKKKPSISSNLSNYAKDMKESISFIFHSSRMRSFTIFQVIFYSLIKIFDVYRSDLLLEIGVPEEQYSMIMGFLILTSSFAMSFIGPVEKKFKKRTITYLSLSFILSAILVGVITISTKNSIIIPFVLMLYAIQYFVKGIWWILEYKYLKNFTREKTRDKLTFGYEFVTGICASIASGLAAILVEGIDISYALLIVSLIGFIGLILSLDYMRNRFGLEPEQYKKKDIYF